MANRAPNRLCHLSTAESKTNRQGLLCFPGETRSERGDVPPARPSCYRLFRSTCSPSNLIHSHVSSLSVCGAGRVKDPPREVSNTVVCSPSIQWKFSQSSTGKIEHNLLNLLIPLNLSNPLFLFWYLNACTCMHTSERHPGLAERGDNKAQLQGRPPETIPHFNESPVSPACR